MSPARARPVVRGVGGGSRQRSRCRRGRGRTALVGLALQRERRDPAVERVAIFPFHSECSPGEQKSNVLNLFLIGARTYKLISPGEVSSLVSTPSRLNRCRHRSLLAHHMCPLGACRLTWELYWKAGEWRASTGSCPTTPRPRTVSNVPLNEKMRQCRSRSCTACEPRFSSRMQ